MSSVVISKWVTTEAYRNDPHIVDEGMKMLAACEGILGNYHGFQIENPDIGVTVHVCTDTEVFCRIMEDKELWAKIDNKLSTARIGEPEIYRGTAAGDPFKALVGPINEVHIFTLKVDTPEVRAQIKAASAAEAQKSGGKMTHAWCVDDPKSAIILYSWDSIQAHREVETQPEIWERLKKMQEVVWVDDPNFSVDVRFLLGVRGRNQIVTKHDS